MGEKEKNKKDAEDVWGVSGFEDSKDFQDTTVDPAKIWTDSQSDTEQQFVSDSGYDFKEPKVDDEFIPDEDGETSVGDPLSLGPKSQFGKENKVKISPEVGCTVAAAVNFIEGGVVGALVGGVHAVVDGYSHGFARQAGFGRYVVGASLGSAVSFGGWLGSYKGTKCYMRAMRGKDDTLNSFGGGFVAGLVGSLRTRNPRVMVVSGIGSGILMSVLDVASHGAKHA
jgi:hypothetical protein